ncbi:failed axon connections homolog [Branchiostoma lanceolatum]|uniref:failed axon connections homolog n=1 Tax=Branchiostoma lanceolatum TaxID=7740 RepID=UPI003453FD7C
MGSNSLLQSFLEVVNTLAKNLQNGTQELVELARGGVALDDAGYVVGRNAPVLVLWCLFVFVIARMCCGGRGSRKVKTRENYEPGKVYLHQHVPASGLPSLSPFCLKLEMYLRLADIPYENVYKSLGMEPGPKGKIPWIEYNGRAMADSGLIIQFFKEELEIDLNRPLSTTDRAISRAFVKMLEENTYWGLVYFRWIENFDVIGSLFEVGWFMHNVLLRRAARGLSKTLWAQGIGRHSPEDIYAITEKDIMAVSEFLGEKPFFMGEEPTEADATVYGFMAEILWAAPESSDLYALVTEKCPNVREYCVRMTRRYWQDWEGLADKC